MRCPLCNEVIGEITAAHLMSKHGMTRQEFMEKYPQYKALTSVLIGRFQYSGKPWTGERRKPAKKWR